MVVLPSFFYFVLFSALACFVPYASIFFDSINMSKQQIGILNATLPCIGFFSSPFACYISDQYNYHKFVLLICVALAGAAPLPIVFFDISFPGLVLIVVVISTFQGPVTSLVDGAVLYLLEGQKQLYGKTRTLGAVGWALVASLVGWLIDFIGDPNVIVYAYSSGFAVLFLVLYIGLRHRTPLPEKDDLTETPAEKILDELDAQSGIGGSGPGSGGSEGPFVGFVPPGPVLAAKVSVASPLIYHRGLTSSRRSSFANSPLSRMDTLRASSSRRSSLAYSPPRESPSKAGVGSPLLFTRDIGSSASAAPSDGSPLRRSSRDLTNPSSPRTSPTSPTFPHDPIVYPINTDQGKTDADLPSSSSMRAPAPIHTTKSRALSRQLPPPPVLSLGEDVVGQEDPSSSSKQEKEQDSKETLPEGGAGDFTQNVPSHHHGEDKKLKEIQTLDKLRKLAMEEKIHSDEDNKESVYVNTDITTTGNINGTEIPKALSSTSFALGGDNTVTGYTIFREICGRPRLACFYLNMFVFGAGISVVGNFLFLHLLEDLNASHTLLGLTVVSTIVMEVPVFHHSDKILDRIGIRGMIIIAHVAYIIRVTSYYFLGRAWLVLGIEVLHGLTYALIWPAGVAFASKTAPPGVETTAQGVFGGVFGGIGSAAGALLGGVVYDYFGAKLLFLGSGCTLGFFLIFFILTFQNPERIRDDVSGSVSALSINGEQVQDKNLEEPLLVNAEHGK